MRTAAAPKTTCTGLSCVAGPDGRAIARAETDEELIFAEINTDLIYKARKIIHFFPIFTQTSIKSR